MQIVCKYGLFGKKMAGVTGLEPAASGVTGQRSNQLSYTPAYRLEIGEFSKAIIEHSFKRTNHFVCLRSAVCSLQKSVRQDIFMTIFYLFYFYFDKLIF